MTAAGYLLDTNVISESITAQPDARVMRWLAEVDEDRAFLSVATVAEIRFGVERMPQGRRRDELAGWLEHGLVERFEGRFLGVDRAVAHLWGAVMARGDRAGFPVGVMDALLAAIASGHGLTLVTRSVRHFAALDIVLLDP